MKVNGIEILSTDDEQNKRYDTSQIQRSPLFIIFCIPGNNFSNTFVKCLFETFKFCNHNKIGFALSIEHSSVVHFARNKCLGGNTLRGEGQLPFDNKIEYSHIMWIDSDIVWSPNQIVALLERNVHIASGLYRLAADNDLLCAVEHWDENYFAKNGCFEFLKYSDIKDKKELIKVAYSGFGFMLIKRGVFEAIKYPWFKSIDQKIGNIVDFTSEDTGFCLKVTEKNLDIYVDPTVIVGHEKKSIWL